MGSDWKRRFRLLKLYEKRNQRCRRRGCQNVPQWGETGGSNWVSNWLWCDEHVMKRIRLFGLRDLTIEHTEGNTVTGSGVASA